MHGILDGPRNNENQRDSVASCRSRLYCLVVGFCWLSVAVLTLVQIFYLYPSNAAANARIEEKCRESLSFVSNSTQHTMPINITNATTATSTTACPSTTSITMVNSAADHLFLSWCELVPFEQSWSASNVMSRAIGIVVLTFIAILLLAAFSVGRSARHGCINIQCGCFFVYWLLTIGITFLQIFLASVVVRDARMRQSIAQSTQSFNFSLTTVTVHSNSSPVTLLESPSPTQPIGNSASPTTVTPSTSFPLPANTASDFIINASTMKEESESDSSYTQLLDLNIIIYSLSALLSACALLFEGIITAARERSYFTARRMEKVVQRSNTSFSMRSDLKKLDDENWN